MDKDELIVNNVNLVYFVLQKMNLYHMSDYYYDIGLIGLVKAAHEFDSSKGYKFSSFATMCIRNAIIMDIRKENKYKRTADREAISLEDPIANSSKNGKEQFLIDIIPSDFDMEEYITTKEEIVMLNKAVLTLKQDEQNIFNYYYRDGMTQPAIAKILNMTQANVSRKLKKIVKKLRSVCNYE